MGARSFNLANKAFVSAITIPATGAPAAVPSLAAGLAAELALRPHSKVVAFSIEQGAAAFNWGHSAAACLALVAAGAEKEFPVLDIDGTFVKSTDGATVAAVLVAWIAW